ncbi:MAG: NAD(P)-dependent oxidoreductase [Alphaproteobacteria bacterium]
MDAFPAYYSLSGRKVVIAGSGEAASAKARLFESSPAEIVRIEGEKAFDPLSYSGAVLAFVGSDDEDFCAQAAFAARQAGVPVNVTDRPALSDFSSPAVIDRGTVVAAVGTGGASPMLASILRGEIENQIPEGAGRLAALLNQMRDQVREALPEMDKRRDFLREAINGPAAEAAMDGDMVRARALIESALRASGGARSGALYLLDGRGPVDLLSLRAIRTLAEVDAAVVEAGVDPGVQSRIRRDAPRLSLSAGEILARTTSGARLVVITAGPPSAAMLETAKAGGIRTEVLPVAPPLPLNKS